MSHPRATSPALLPSLICMLVAAGALAAPRFARADVVIAHAPAGLVFVGLRNDRWLLFAGTGDANPRSIATVTDPRTPAYSKGQQRIAYVSSEGAVREIDLRTGEDAVLLESTRSHGYTQLAYRPGTAELYLVVLHQGSSVDTDLAVLDRDKRQARIVSRQRSAQFEPAFTSDGAQLIYSNVSCASECPNIVQEIWSMDLVSGVVQQLTLLNAVSRQPTIDAAGAVVFASNEQGHYQLWRLAPGAQPVRLTDAAAIDESPVSSDRGEVYFIRRTADGGQLMRMDANGSLTAVALGRDIRDVRDLRWGN